jgi:hypothetical protein
MLEVFKRPPKSIVFTLALGITDRPKRWHTPGKFFVQVGDMFEAHGIDCYYFAHPDVKLKWIDNRTSWRIESASELERIMRPLNPGYLFVWNGNFGSDRETVKVAHELGAKPVFGEIGWFPQADTMYFDFEGTNFRSSIRGIDLSQVDVDVRIGSWIDTYTRDHAGEGISDAGYLFVPLQDEQDTNITDASPYRRMNDFVRDLSARFPSERIVVRRHPRFMEVELDTYDNVEYRNDGNLYDWLSAAKGVVGINSTVLLESLLYDKPVYTVGQGLASGLGVFHEFAKAGDIVLCDEVDETMRGRRRALLSELVYRRMLQRSDLEKPDVICRYFVFTEIIDSLKGPKRKLRWLP